MSDAIIRPECGPPRSPSDLSDEEIVDGVSSALTLEPAHRLELLEADGAVERAERLINQSPGANGSVLL